MKCAIILAGGKGTRMKSELPKVMCEVLFEPMLKYVIDAVREAGCEDICVVTGYRHEIVEDYLPGEIKTAYQNPQLGTGHAVMTARAFVEQHKDDDILILNGDGPLMDEPTINAAYDYHKSNENSITLVSAIADDTAISSAMKTASFFALLSIRMQMRKKRKSVNQMQAHIGSTAPICFMRWTELQTKMHKMNII